MVCVEDLTFTYAGNAAETLHGLSFAIEPGEIVGFLGPSGSGKSTTQKILIGLLKGYGGRAQVLGREVRDWGPDLYERIGVGFEMPNHYLKLSAVENLSFFGSLYAGGTQDPLALLERVGLSEDADKRVENFSKGMRMRLNFVRALLHEPELLFFDEPTTGLDPVNAAVIKDIIREQKARGKTIFLTTHNMVVADELCDRCAFLVDGNIVLLDSPRELKLQHGERMVRIDYHVDGRLDAQEFPLDDLAENEAFLSLLREHRIETIHSQETTLERIFIKVTGRRLQ